LKTIILNCLKCNKKIKSIDNIYSYFPFTDASGLKSIRKLNHNEKINDLVKFKLDNKNYYFLFGIEKTFHLNCEALKNV